VCALNSQARSQTIDLIKTTAVALSYSRLDRRVRIDTVGCRTIRIAWIVNTLLALSTILSEAANFFSYVRRRIPFGLIGGDSWRSLRRAGQRPPTPSPGTRTSSTLLLGEEMMVWILRQVR
jgi:hypothetical protein